MFGNLVPRNTQGPQKVSPKILIHALSLQDSTKKPLFGLCVGDFSAENMLQDIICRKYDAENCLKICTYCINAWKNSLNCLCRNNSLRFICLKVKEKLHAKIQLYFHHIFCVEGLNFLNNCCRYLRITKGSLKKKKKKKCGIFHNKGGGVRPIFHTFSKMLEMA